MLCAEQGIMRIQKYPLSKNHADLKSDALQMLSYNTSALFMSDFTGQGQVMKLIPIDEWAGGINVLEQKPLPRPHPTEKRGQKIELAVQRHMVQHVDHEKVVVSADVGRKRAPVVHCEHRGYGAWAEYARGVLDEARRDFYAA